MKPIRHLLIIRLSAMGDVAMTVPVLKAFLEAYPKIKVTVLTKAFLVPLFSQFEHVNVHVAEVKGKHKGIFGLWRLFKELRAQKIDAVADLHHVLRSTILKLFFSFQGAQFRQLDKGRSEKKALISGNQKDFRALKSMHERYVDVFAALGFVFELPKTAVLQQETPSTLFNLRHLDTEKKRIGIAPFAAYKGKMYPIEHMEAVVAQLNTTEQYVIFLFGGGAVELERLSAWESNYQNVHNASNKGDFSEELELISNLDLMVAMDSGNGHLSAMYGVPTLTLWGVTHPYAGFGPFGQPEENSLLADRKVFSRIPTSIYGNKMPEGYEKAMETIPPAAIVAKIAKLTI